MSEDEYDDELPPIDVNSSAAKENQYVMPSADVIASQRAYEEVCEQELRQLRSQYECEDVVTLCHDSSGSEGEATLAAAIESMKVQSTQATSQLDAVQLLQKFISSASDWDITLLNHYLDVLQNEDADTVRHVTDNIMSSIEDVVKQSVRSGNTLNQQELQVVGLWLCAASLWTSPRVPSARRCLQVLLNYLTEPQLELWCGVVGGSLDSASLVRASDVITAPAPADRAASTALLRTALHTLTPQFKLHRTQGPLSVKEVCEALCGAWRTLSPAQQYTAAQVAGRVLIDAVSEDSDNATLNSEALLDDMEMSEATIDVAENNEAHVMGLSVKNEAPLDVPKKSEAIRCAISRLLTLMATQLPQHRYRPDYLRVLMAVSKLQNLFKNYEAKEQRK